MKFTTFSWDSLPESKKLSTGNSEIDRVLKGGFRTRILNEIVGTGGSGKTQVCIYLSLMVQLSENLGGFNKGNIVKR